MNTPRGNALVIAVIVAVVAAALLLIFTKPSSPRATVNTSSAQQVVPGSGDEIEVENGAVIEEDEAVVDENVAGAEDSVTEPDTPVQ